MITNVYSLVKKLNIKQSTSDSDVAMVMYNTTEDIVEELLDVSNV